MTQELEVQNNSAKYYEEKRYVGLGFAYHSYIINRMAYWGALLKGKILDAGCGTGILPRLYETKDIFGIDMSYEMLKYYPTSQKANMSAEDLIFENEHFNTIFCRSLLHHLPNPEKALSEFRRVIKRGGRVLIWETNKSFIAQIIRRLTQHGGRFSEYHTAFNNLPSLVSKYFEVEKVVYCGFLAYPLFGFPDIVDWKLSQGVLGALIKIDEFLEKIPFIRRLSFAVMIYAKKR